MVKLQLISIFANDASMPRFRFGMVKLQPVIAEAIARYEQVSALAW